MVRIEAINAIGLLRDMARRHRDKGEPARPLEEAEASTGDEIKPDPWGLPEEMELEFGQDVVPIFKEDEIVEMVGRVRALAFIERGIIVPPVRCRDNIHMEPNACVFKIRGATVGSFELYADKFLAVESLGNVGPPAGTFVEKTQGNLHSGYGRCP